MSRERMPGRPGSSPVRSATMSVSDTATVSGSDSASSRRSSVVGTRGQRLAGLTLLEITLAIVISILILTASVVAVKQYRTQSRIQQAKINLATIRQNIAMWKYRCGTYPPLGDANGVTTLAVAANPADTTLTVASANGLCRGQGLRLVSGANRLDVQISEINGNVLTLQNPTPLGGALVWAIGTNIQTGIGSNLLDLAGPGVTLLKFLEVPEPPGAPIVGHGLGDPQLGYLKVRDSAAADVPCWTPGDTRAGCNGFSADRLGYQVVPARAATDVWGGLAYNPDPNLRRGGLAPGQIEYILPDPASEPAPELGYFPGDPPANWGK
ncbi:MAG: type II secretion system protein [Cyanobacteria bacterium NC_groundwater_1444_Ag_S-0.65um_54_12]|nr:type II secretion system protein [Cyanobacteria bacterium NC_groundwater_1444_Ag_S-0.65um_54_12]